MTFHPQADRQSERTIQTLEDMIRDYAIVLKGSWDSHLSLTKFAYNNHIFHVSILRKYMHDPSHIFAYELLQVFEDLSNEEQPVMLFDNKE